MNESEYRNVHASKHAGKVAHVTGVEFRDRTCNRQAARARGCDRLHHWPTTARVGQRSARDRSRCQGPTGRHRERGLTWIASIHGLRRLKVISTFCLPMPAAGEFVPLPFVTEAQFEKYVGINFKGTLFTVQKALPLMRPVARSSLPGQPRQSRARPPLAYTPPRRRLCARSPERGHPISKDAIFA